MQAIQSTARTPGFVEAAFMGCVPRGKPVVNQARTDSKVSPAPQISHSELRRNVDAMLEDAARYPDIPLAY